MNAESTAPASPSALDSDSEEAAASLLELPLHFEVMYDAETEENFYFLIHRQSAAQAHFQNAEVTITRYWTLLAPCYFAFAVGIYACISSEMVLSATIILVVAAFVGKQQRQLNESIRKRVDPEDKPQKGTILITTAGISQFDQGLVSAFDWAAMHHWEWFRSTLYIQLRNSKWVILPSKGLVPAETNLQLVCSFLKIKGVPPQNNDRPS